MMKALFSLALVVCCAFPAYAMNNNVVPSMSLFFTQQEMIEAGISAHKAPPTHEGEIHLGAVMYYGPDDWALWLQGEKWTPGMEHTDLHILEVTADNVRLLWKGENGAEAQEITLKPNESYDIASGKVISQP